MFVHVNIENWDKWVLFLCWTFKAFLFVGKFLQLNMMFNCCFISIFSVYLVLWIFLIQRDHKNNTIVQQRWPFEVTLFLSKRGFGLQLFQENLIQLYGNEGSFGYLPRRANLQLNGANHCVKYSEMYFLSLRYNQYKKKCISGQLKGKSSSLKAEWAPSYSRASMHCVEGVY